MTAMDVATVQAAYTRWSKVYDWTFGALLSGARRKAVRTLDLKAGDSALEVGVGTGLSFPLIPAGCRFTGVDFSRAMLDRALPRLRSRAVVCDGGLVEADGARLPFPDATFDAAIAPFVVSAAPDPVALLHDMVRVCRPGARLVVLNHFTPRSRALARVEQSVSTLTSAMLGFRADFPLEPLFAEAGIEIEDVRRATMIGSWYTVTFTRRDGR